MLRATVGLILASIVCNLVAIIVFGALGDITNDYIPQVSHRKPSTERLISENFGIRRGRPQQ